MPDGQTTTQVPDEQQELLEHIETIEEILAREDHTVNEVEQSVAYMLEHYNVIRESATEAGISSLIREKVQRVLTHKTLEDVRPEHREGLEKMIKVERAEETEEEPTKVTIYGKRFEIPYADPDKAFEVLTAISGKFAEKLPTATSVSEDDIRIFEDIQNYMREDYPDDTRINELTENMVQQLVVRKEILETKKEPPAPRPPEPKPEPKKEVKEEHKVDLFKEALKKDEDFKNAVDILKTTEHFRDSNGEPLDGTKMKIKAVLRGLHWGREYCNQLQAWLKLNTDVENILAKRARDINGMRKLKREIFDKLKTLEDAKINTNLHRYLKNSPEEKKKRQEIADKEARKEEEKRVKEEAKQARHAEKEAERQKREKGKRKEEEKEKTNKAVETALREHPVLLEGAKEAFQENPEYPKLFLTAWRIYQGKDYKNLKETDRDKIKVSISGIIKTSKIDSKETPIAVSDDIKTLLKGYADVLRSAEKTPPPKGGKRPTEKEPPEEASAEKEKPSEEAPPEPTPPKTKARATAEKPHEVVPMGLEARVDNLMAEVLSDKFLYDKERDAASSAVYNLIKEKIKGSGLASLKGFLLKPKLTLTPEVDELIKESITDLRSMLKEREQKEKEINRKINGIDKLLGGRGTIKKEDADALFAKQAELQKQLNTIENKKDKINMAIGYKNGTMRYRSVTQLLAMINYYVSSEIDSERPSQADIIQRVDDQIEGARKKIDKSGKIRNLAFGALTGFTMLKPTLPATLENLVRDEHLGKIGAEKLKRLAKVWDNKGGVDAWINSLEGSEEDRITKVVPRIIAYLEMALRDGNMRYLRPISAGRAKRLVENLKAARHDYITNKIEREMSGDQHSDIDRMNAYFRELNNATVTKNEITKKLISRQAKFRMGGAGLVIGGLGRKLGIIPEKGAHKELDEAGRKTKKEESVKAWRRGAGRAVGATALGVGATLLTGGVLLPVLAAIPGIFSPEIIKHRKEIKEKGLAAGKVVVPKAGSLAKFSLLFGLTGGLYGAYKLKQKLTAGPTFEPDLPIDQAA